MGTLKGFFKAKNPKRYIGNPEMIVYRSSWEFRVMMQLDHGTNVVRWASEEFSIPYYDPTTNRVRRYFPDFYVEYTNGKTFVFEVKPASQTKPSKSKNARRLLKENITYARNLAKWNSATTYCEDKGWTFKVITEKQLNLI